MKMQAPKGNKIAIWVLMLAFAAALITAAATACSSDTQAADDANQSSGGQTLALTEADNGGDFTVKVGDTITVTLVGNATTGYEWASDLSAEAASQLKMEGEAAYEQDEAPEEMVGVGGKFVFTFTAVAAGQAELKLKHWRSFEPDTAPIDTFTANITVE